MSFINVRLVLFCMMNKLVQTTYDVATEVKYAGYGIWHWFVEI